MSDSTASDVLQPSGSVSVHLRPIEIARDPVRPNAFGGRRKIVFLFRPNDMLLNVANLENLVALCSCSYDYHHAKNP